jgi:Spy/CpxP family protein refolding chaperone
MGSLDVIYIAVLLLWLPNFQRAAAAATAATMTVSETTAAAVPHQGGGGDKSSFQAMEEQNASNSTRQRLHNRLSAAVTAQVNSTAVASPRTRAILISLGRPGDRKKK